MAATTGLSHNWKTCQMGKLIFRPGKVQEIKTKMKMLSKIPENSVEIHMKL